MQDQKRRCNDCGKLRPWDSVHTANRQSGGSYRQAGSIQRTNICWDCIQHYLPYIARFNDYVAALLRNENPRVSPQRSMSRWGLSSLSQVLDRLYTPQRPPQRPPWPRSGQSVVQIASTPAEERVNALYAEERAAFSGGGPAYGAADYPEERA